MAARVTTTGFPESRRESSASGLASARARPGGPTPSPSRRAAAGRRARRRSHRGRPRTERTSPSRATAAYVSAAPVASRTAAIACFHSFFCSSVEVSPAPTTKRSAPAASATTASCTTNRRYAANHPAQAASPVTAICPAGTPPATRSSGETAAVIPAACASPMAWRRPSSVSPRAPRRTKRISFASGSAHERARPQGDRVEPLRRARRASASRERDGDVGVLERLGRGIRHSAQKPFRQRTARRRLDALALGRGAPAARGSSRGPRRAARETSRRPPRSRGARRRRARTRRFRRRAPARSTPTTRAHPGSTARPPRRGRTRQTS